MIFIAFFYYENEKKLYLDLRKSKMQNIASKLSAKITYSHMAQVKLDLANSFNKKDYKIALYDRNGKKVYGDINEKIDLNKKFFISKNNYILIDKSTFGHLGIYAIAVKEKLFYETLDELIVNIIFIFLFIYSLIALLGFYLGKLFIKPIKDEKNRLNRFIKDTTHELNTPISAILMSVESDNLNEKQLERVRLSAKRVSEIYKDLSYLFLEKSDKKQKIEKINLKNIIEEQLQYFELLAKKKKVDLVLNLSEVEYEILEDDFIRIFNNLLSNALKYNISNGFVKIILTNKKLLIEDSGIGIEKKELDNIFKRYYRATSQNGGFGIGLNIVKEICDKYNIQIKVKSRLEKGSSFTLEF